MRTLVAVSIGSLCLFGLFACGGGGGDKPHLVSGSDKQKQQQPVFAGVIDQVRSFPMTSSVGLDLNSNQDSVVNDGKPFNGLKVIVQGNAFSNGFLGAPKPCLVEIYKRPGENVNDKGSASFTQTGPGVYTAVVPIMCHDIVAFEFSAPSLKAGDSSYEVIAGPEDGSAPPVTFKHPALITPDYMSPKLNEREPGSPTTDNATSPSASAPSESAPKTQYELQQQQEQQRQKDGQEQKEAEDDLKKLE